MTVYRMQLKKDWKIFRFPPWVGMILLYISYGLAGVFDMRSSLIGAGFGATGMFGLSVGSGLSLTITPAIFLLSGLSGWIFFELLSWVFCYMVRLRFPHFNAVNMRHILRCFFTVRNLILAPIYTVLFFYPLSIVWVTTVITFAVTTLTVTGFYFYYVNRNLPAFMHGQALLIMGQTYLTYHLICAGLLFMGMML